MGGHVDLLVHENYNVVEFGYGYGPSSGPVPDTRVFGDDEDCAYEKSNNEYDEDVDDECNGDVDVDDECNGDADVEAYGHASSFRTFNQVLENEQKIYVSAQAPSCDVSNNPDAETLDESSPIHYHLPPMPQLNMLKT